MLRATTFHRFSIKKDKKLLQYKTLNEESVGDNQNV